MCLRGVGLYTATGNSSTLTVGTVSTADLIDWSAKG
jgi:hypothetical protein